MFYLFAGDTPTQSSSLAKRHNDNNDATIATYGLWVALLVYLVSNSNNLFIAC